MPVIISFNIILNIILSVCMQDYVPVLTVYEPNFFIFVIVCKCNKLVTNFTPYLKKRKNAYGCN